MWISGEESPRLRKQPVQMAQGGNVLGRSEQWQESGQCGWSVGTRGDGAVRASEISQTLCIIVRTFGFALSELSPRGT